MKDLAEVCPLSRGMMSQSLFPLLQGDVRFLRIPLPALPLTHLAVVYRYFGRERAYRVLHG